MLFMHTAGLYGLMPATDADSHAPTQMKRLPMQDAESSSHRVIESSSDQARIGGVMLASAPAQPAGSAPAGVGFTGSGRMTHPCPSL